MHGRGAFIVEKFFGRFRIEELGDRVVQLVDDRLRRAGRRDDAPPVGRHIAGHAGFGDGRQVGQDRAALRAAGGERPQLAALDVRHRLHDRGEHHLGFAGDHREHGRPAAFVGHVLHVDIGGQLEQFAAQMLKAADAGGRIVEHARLFLGERQQFLDRMHRHGRIDGQHIGAGGDDADRHEVLHRIERLLVDPGVDGVRDGNDQKRVAVGGRLCGEIGADDAAGAAAVIDKDLLAQSLAELIGDDAADHVVAAARRERDDHADRAARIIVRGCCRRGEYRQREHKRNEKCAERNPAKFRHQ